MDSIRPASDLQTHFADIAKTVHDTARPVFLTKDGYGDMVLMSMEAYEGLRLRSEIDFKLREAEREMEASPTRFSPAEVMRAMLDAVGD